MDYLGFKINLLICYIKQHKLLYAVMLLTFCIALVFPLMTVSDVVFRQKSLERYPEMPPRVFVNYSGNQESSEKIVDMLKSKNDSIDFYARRSYSSRNLIYFKHSYLLAHLEGVDEVALEKYYSLYSGRGFTRERS